MHAAGRTFHGQLSGSGRWKIAEFGIAPVSFAADADGAPILIEGDTDVTLHMIEVARGNGSR